MLQGGDVDFSALVDDVVVWLPSWQGITTKYITASFLFAVGGLFSSLGMRVPRAGPPYSNIAVN
jgi:hypothetical protein